LVPLFVLAHFSHHLIAALLPPLLPFIRDDLAVDYSQAGWVVSAFNLSYGLSQLPGGWLSDRFGPRILTVSGISGVALCGLLIGLSPNYIMMITFLVLLGVFGGGYHPATSPLVSASVSEKSRGRALGLHQIGGTASFFLTPLIAAGIASALGWRGSFIALAIPTFLFGIVLYVLLGRRYTPRSDRGPATTESQTPAAPTRWRHLVAFTTLGIAIQVFIFSMMSFIPLFVVDQFQASKETGAALFSLYHFAGFWAGPLGGYLSDRLGRVPVMLTVGILAGPLLYLFNLVSFGWSISLVLVIAGTAQYISMPVSEAYIISHTGQHNRSTILGIYYFASRGGPGLLLPAVGYLIDHFGFGPSFTMVGAVLLGLALACSTFLWGSRD